MIAATQRGDGDGSRGILAALLLFACVCFLPGIGWGLPSRSADPFLFGNRKPWTGKEILSLAPGWGDDANRAADVAAHPLANRDQPIIVNQTDAQRAAIVRRYRLYSDQPDEMITLRALAQMKPGKLQFDPKLYQYGGLWVYPIGAILKLASIVHLVKLTPDLAFYLDHPQAFGRLYVLMRLYSVAWGLAGVVVTFRLATRIGQSRLIGAIAAICYVLLPTVINGAHEAKPHLAGAVLGLIAIDFADRAVMDGKRFWAIATGVACGAAASMVLSELLLVGILPAMAFCMLWHQWHGRPAHVSSQLSSQLSSPGRKIIGEPPMPLTPPIPQIIALLMAACMSALATYAICNPYVIVHLLGDRAVLQSNLENSAAMYQTPASLVGIEHGVTLLMEGGSIIIFAGLIALIFFAFRKATIAWLLLAATLPALAVFFAHAAGKPGEYGRFALPIDVLWILGLAMGLSLFTRKFERAVAGTVLLLILLPLSFSYIRGYQLDAGIEPTRLVIARQLRSNKPTTLAIDAEPAPYALPPVNLFDWKWILLPRDAWTPADADLRIDPWDLVGGDQPHVRYFIHPILLSTPISWAAKPFRVQTREDAVPVGPEPR